MRILLEELPHQEASLEAILASFPGIDEQSNDPDANYVYANPLIKGRYNENINIDVKMETGTGKTYVYTRMMYELHQQTGLFKFILVVPSPAIKEGTKNFIQSDYAKQHFSQFYGNTKIELNVINAGDFTTRSGRKNFPAQLLNFVEGSHQNANSIQVLLINAGMLNSANMKKDDYDQTLIGGVTSPLVALQNTCPVIIVDEPHRFPRDKANYKAIQALNPQMIIRFGATFPTRTEGTGRNKVVIKDYYRNKPQFDLNAVESFNGGLVKGIDIYYPDLTETQARNTYKVQRVAAKELVLKQGQKEWTLGVGDNLAEVTSEFEGDVTYVGSKTLSNNLELEAGMTLVPGTFRSSYQELIIHDAIDRHFETEQENFLRENNKEYNSPRIKSLSLFFIDSINSYRQSDGWLKQTFERILNEKLTRLIREYEFKRQPREEEYLSFLQATQASLNSDTQNVHAGYFGEDRGSGDEAIQAEVNDILKNKEKLLSFKDENGNWQTRRFLFSKWTLREGWDNPNVFVIAKLRTSGSENSKIQEVGRGLRLPVDETGHRVQQDEWSSRLAFLIGYDEKEFAKLLVGEINSDTKLDLNETMLTEEMISAIVESRQKIDASYTEDILLEELDGLGLITRSNNFRESVTIDGVEKSGFDWLMSKYPELDQNRLQKDRVRENNKPDNKLRIRLKKENWAEIKDLWKQFSKRYMVAFERIPEDNMADMVKSVLLKRDNYTKQQPSRIRQSVEASDDNRRTVLREQDTLYNHQYLPGLKYGQFIKRLTIATGIPVKLVHRNLLHMLKNDLHGDQEYLSEDSLATLIREFKNRFEERYSQEYEFKPLEFQARTSVYDVETDDFVKDIGAEVIGVHIDEEAAESSSYLYENPPMRYDSVNPERELLRHDYGNKVTVFGKLPKKAIQVPKYTGGTTTPDFVFVVEKEDDTSVYLLVETKAENMRIGDARIVEIQKKFFEMLKDHQVKYKEATSAKDVYKEIEKLSKGVNE